ncbi:MAG: anti-sigma factor [Candidatus Dormibacteraeota bacterium]|uniref:Regulator of SigK n=1 Tax=Candidatus Aeolococcus gillhamiae TaxID=3127015 RepID=A0A934N2T0_9BACT|nr:anti-sigma factor [Candidatus Dormibacteraeota bacterium]
MPVSHDEVDSLLAAYALDAVSEREAADVREHLDGCSDCRDAAARLAAAVEALPMSVDIQPAPLGLRERVLQATRTGTPHTAEPGPTPLYGAPTHRSAEPPRRTWARRAATAVAVAALLALAGWNLELQTQLHSVQQTVDALRDAHAVTTNFRSSVAGTGTMTYLPQERVSLVMLRGLESLDPGRVYQLWFLRSAGSKLRPAGTFVRQAGGSALLVVPDEIDTGGGVAVSIEPLGGSDAPTSVLIMTATI